MTSRRGLITLLLFTAAGCGEYTPRPLPQAAPAGGNAADNNADPSAMPGGPGMQPPGAGPAERQRLDQVGVRRVELSNVVGVYLNAKASINSRMMAMNARTVAEQFKAEQGRYPADYAELETRLQSEGKALPELQPGHRYVFDPSDGQVYVESGG